MHAQQTTQQQPAQETRQPTTTLTVTTQVVALDALVRNHDGDLVQSLDKADFTLKVDGKPTDIRYFNRDNDLPLTIGLLVDTSGSEAVYFDEEARSSQLFFEHILTNPEDRALVVRFDSRVLELQKMTSSQPALRNALRLLDYRDPAIGTTHGGTLLYDALAIVCKSVINHDTGRRALLVLTDGDDNGSAISLDEAIHQAQLNNVAIYSVLYTREVIGGAIYPHSGSSRPSGIDIMRQIAKATGGRSFIVGMGQSTAQIYAEIEADLRSQYRFGFTPPPSKPGKFHSLDLRPTDRRLTIQSRAGYYTPQ